MTITSGTRLNHYEVISRIGAGGMGEIYLAQDTFSFGRILFDAVTGQRAFAGQDAIDTLNKIIREPVPPITDFRPDASGHLQRIIRRCLAKDRDTLVLVKADHCEG